MSCEGGGLVKFEASDHGDSILAGLKQLRERDLLFDVVLTVQGKRFPVHRVVLAACCDYFRAMFTDGLRESWQSEIELNGVTATGLKNLIDFAYTSKILLDFDNVEDILVSANHVQMVPVITACADFLTANLSLENCVDMLNMAELFSMRTLREIILRFMCSNLTKLSSCPSFYQKLSHKHLLTVLMSDFPVDCTETDVLTSVLDWISYQFDQRSQFAMSLLSQVHMKNVQITEFSLLPNISVWDRIVDAYPAIQRMTKSCQELPRGVLTTESGLINERGFCKSLVCVGGFSPKDGMSNKISYYHAQSHSWKTLTAIPHVDQCNFGHVTLNNELYVVGGCFNDQIQEVVHQYGFCYNPEKNAWRSIAALEHERCRFYLGALKGKLYAIGGDPLAGDITEEMALSECYSPGRKQVDRNSSSCLATEHKHAGIVHHDYLYISGGSQDSDDEFYSSFYRYDPENDSWTELCPLITPRADHTMFVYNDQIHCIGGWYENVLQQRILVSTIDRYDAVANIWETIASVPEPRLFASYAIIDGKVYVVGGWLNGRYQDKAKAVQVYSFIQNQWMDQELPEIELWEHSCCCLYVPNH
ncbi:hypothetical protein FSP39_015449 [Pinctada imbricata]|uniref:BTB domain-containing protein n=1 Tax=Pinctada imbricata TaxID=66713 RepID=A0AA88XRL1_PINIB|nr:hypothetical protein FSP39_015449 [Pinctada imbricata]